MHRRGGILCLFPHPDRAGRHSIQRAAANPNAGPILNCNVHGDSLANRRTAAHSDAARYPDSNGHPPTIAHGDAPAGRHAHRRSAVRHAPTVHIHHPG